MATQKLTVYFDGGCPLCRREIAFYRKMPEAQALRWADVSEQLLTDQDLSCEAALRRFHVRNADGRLLSGGAAFACLWRALPYWRVLGWFFAWPPMSWVLEAAYRVFLPVRPWLQRLARR